MLAELPEVLMPKEKPQRMETRGGFNHVKSFIV